jgi:hypothetical protein
LQDHQNDVLEVGDLVALTAPNTAWVARVAAADVQAEQFNFEIRWVEVEEDANSVRFLGGHSGDTNVVTRGMLLGPLHKFIATHGYMLPSTWKHICSIGKRDHLGQQPLDLGLDPLPTFTSGPFHSLQSQIHMPPESQLVNLTSNLDMARVYIKLVSSVMLNVTIL